MTFEPEVPETKHAVSPERRYVLSEGFYFLIELLIKHLNN